MRGDEDGHVIGGDVFEPCEEVDLAAHVKMRRRLVEEQHLGLSDKGTGQSDRLLLAARETTPAFGDRHVVAEGVAGDEILDAGETRGGDDFLVGRGRFSKRDIVADLAEEKIGVLQHETDAGTQIRRVVLARINIVDDYFSFGGLVEAAQQAADGGLAGPDTADDSDTLAAGNLERDLVERRLIGPGVVERYFLEGDAAFFDVPRNVHAFRRTFALEVHDAINALERDQSLCGAGDDGGNARDGCEHATRQHGAGDQHADSDLAVEDEEDADDDHQQVIELLRSAGAGERQRRPAVHFLAGAGGGGHGALPGVLHAGLGTGCAHGLDAGKRLDQHAVACGGLRLQLPHGALERPLQDEADDDHYGQDHQRNEGERTADHEQNGDENNGEEEIGDGNDGAGGEEFSHRVEFADLIGENADGPRRLRHPPAQHRREEVRGHDDVELLARPVDDAAAHHADVEVVDDRNAHADRQRDHRGHGAVRDYAVVDVHDEEGARQSQQIDKQRGHSNVAVVRPEAARNRPEPVRTG